MTPALLRRTVFLSCPSTTEHMPLPHRLCLLQGTLTPPRPDNLAGDEGIADSGCSSPSTTGQPGGPDDSRAQGGLSSSATGQAAPVFLHRQPCPAANQTPGRDEGACCAPSGCSSCYPFPSNSPSPKINVSGRWMGGTGGRRATPFQRGSLLPPVTSSFSSPSSPFSAFFRSSLPYRYGCLQSRTPAARAVRGATLTRPKEPTRVSVSSAATYL